MGRGSSGAKTAAKTGGRNLAGLSDNIISSPNTALSQLGQFSSMMEIEAPKFTDNGNSVKYQGAVLKSGEDEIELAFYSDYNPRQVAKPTEAIKTKVIARTYKNGNVTSARTLLETSTKSLKNAKKQYESVLPEWMKATGQKKIAFK